MNLPPLTACHLTLTGAYLGSPPRWPLRQRLAAAARAGFSGVGLRVDDVLDSVGAGKGLTELAALLADLGLEVHELEAARGWYRTGEQAAAARQQEEQVYRIADVVGGRHVTTVAERKGELPEMPWLAERFHDLCARAAGHGLMIALEFVPHLTVLRDLTTARAIVAAAGAANGGVMLDPWHLFHSGGSADDVRALAPHSLTAVQLCDGPPVSVRTLERQLPGEGTFDLAGVVSALRPVGFDGPIGVEVISRDFYALPLPEMAARAFLSTQRVVSEALELG
jgi:sugar phosphate isomerase/epimerase